ncbi:MAG: hypothetical protein ACR2PZ_16275 [Pseudomonadales bacterium]
MKILLRLFHVALATFTCTALMACAANGPRLEPSLDPNSGEMVVALRSAAVFTRAEPGLSPAARDYVYLGPVETNVSGQQNLYLWVGLAGTIDRPGLLAEPVAAQALLLQLNDNSIIVALQDWHSDSQHSPFDIPVPLQRSMRALVTAEQLQQIARAEQLSLALIDANGEQRPYGHWSGATADWYDAPDDAEVAFQVRVHTPRQP